MSPAGAATAQLASQMAEANLIGGQLQNQELQAKLEKQSQELADKKLRAADTARLAYSTIEKTLTHPGLESAVGFRGAVDPRNYVWGTDAKGAQA